MPGTGAQYALSLARIAAGLMLFVFHGLGKLTGAFNYFANGQEWRFVGVVTEMGLPLPSLLALLVALIESVGGILLVVGLFTRQVAMLIAVILAVAAYRGVTTGGLFELPLLYLVVMLVFAFQHQLPWSVGKLKVRREKA